MYAFPTLKFFIKLIIISAILQGCKSEIDDNSKTKVSLERNDAEIISMSSKALPDIITRLSFGSCLSEKKDQSIWNNIAAEKPDAFIFMGDNVYGDAYYKDPIFDDPNMPKMQAAYQELAQSRQFKKFRDQVPVIPTWDDHDYGLNDGGASYKFKEKSKNLFLKAWDIPPGDVRYQRQGIYASKTLGQKGQRIQIIMLDTRSFRTELTPTDQYNAPGKERYIPSTSEKGTLLGLEQWSWLKEQLEKPADLRILVSTIQVIADGHGWEAWRTMPYERNKLYKLIKDTNVENLIILSGDRHAGAFYEREDLAPFKIHEVTSSSLNLPGSYWRSKNNDTSIESGPYRTTPMQYEPNYGLMDIDWNSRIAHVSLVSPGNITFDKEISF
ncbi:MAG: alkaline phosphatase family protein [Hellea sp.]|nr:alkaline phosphatase family protein [Hellea sp.]